jgi:hypothetical protein
VRDLQRSAHGLHGGLDIISLDIDGNDYWVAEALDLSHVRIVVVEYQPLFGDIETVSVPAKNDFDRSTAHYSHLYYGASLKAFIELFASRGLRFVGTNRCGNNAFFIQDSEVSLFPLPIPSGSDLTPYVRWTVRESRDQSGRLTYLGAEPARAAIAGMPLVDTQSRRSLTVGDCRHSTGPTHPA